MNAYVTDTATKQLREMRGLTQTMPGDNCKTAHKKSTAKQFTPHRSDGNSNWQAAQETMQNGDALGYWAMRKALFIEEDERLKRTSKNNVAGYDFYEDAFEYLVMDALKAENNEL